MIPDFWAGFMFGVFCGTVGMLIGAKIMNRNEV